MSRFTKQQLLDALHALPQTLKDIVLSAERAEVFQSIMDRQGLTVAQMAVVANELAPVTYGLALPGELPGNLKRQLPELPQAKIDALIKDIDEHLLKDLRDKIVALAHENKTATGTSAAPDTQPTAAAPHPLVTDIAQSKLAGNLHLPSDTIRMTESPAKMPEGAPQRPPSPVTENTYTKGTDPYREPIA
jgi:hypothetical protein